MRAVANRAQTAVVWSVPSEPVIAAYAQSLRAERVLLMGDFSALEEAALLVRERARRAAETSGDPGSRPTVGTTLVAGGWSLYRCHLGATRVVAD